MRFKTACLVLAALTAAVGSNAIAGQRNGNASASRTHAIPPPSIAHTTFYIVVNKFGRRIRGSAGTASSQSSDGTGTFIATFPVDVTNCVYVATLARSTTDGGSNEKPGFISAVRTFDNTNGVYVETLGTGGMDRNRPFHLLVAC